MSLSKWMGCVSSHPAIGRYNFNMTPRTIQQSIDIRLHIADYVAGHNIIATKDVITYVEKKTKMRISIQTVWKIIRFEMGYKATKHYWELTRA